MNGQDPMDQPEPEGHSLLVPFVVCRSQGGPYDDESFVAGFEAGMIDRALTVVAAAGGDRAVFTVHSELVKQLELVAMNRGFPVTAVMETEVEGWSFMSFARSEETPE